jgi:amino acid transporter
METEPHAVSAPTASPPRFGAEPAAPIAAAPSLLRALGPVMATAVVVGTVIGSGIFKKPQLIAQNVPGAGWATVVWVLGGVLTLLGGLTLAEVAVLYPRAGGNYVFLREGYGRLAGFLWGWIEFLVIRAASLAALATIFSESLNVVLTEGSGHELHLGFWGQRTLTVAVILALALVNVRGAKWGGMLQVVITSVKVASLLAIIVLPFVLTAGPPPDSGPAGSVGAATALTVGGWLTAQLGVLWAYHGWMNIAPVAEEVKEPQRNIPLALLGGIALIIGLYVGAHLAYSWVLPQDEMARLVNTTVAARFSGRFFGALGTMVASAAVMCSVFGALNGNLLVGPRLLYAMAEDRLAPRALAAVHTRFRTPALAILVMGAWSSLLVLAVAVFTDRDDPFDTLTDLAMFGAVIFETLAVSTIFIFRRRYPDAPRPYRCWGYPVVPALYLILPALILGNMFFNHQLEAATGVGFVALGVVVYALFLRRPAAS